jgi:hypothetical protein
MALAFKLAHVTRAHRGGPIVEIGVRFFDGEASTQLEPDVDLGAALVPVTRFRRGRRLTQRDLPIGLQSFRTRLDASGHEVLIIGRKDLPEHLTETNDQVRDRIKALLS